MVRAAFDAGSVTLRVKVPTAATASSVVRANLRIENEPVTSGVANSATACSVTVDVVGGSVGVVGASVGVVGGSVGGVGVAVPTVPVTGTISRASDG